MIIMSCKFTWLLFESFEIERLDSVSQVKDQKTRRS
jgi:hypothetical protein